MMTLNRKFTAK